MSIPTIQSPEQAATFTIVRIVNGKPQFVAMYFTREEAEDRMVELGENHVIEREET